MRYLRAAMSLSAADAYERLMRAGLHYGRPIEPPRHNLVAAAVMSRSRLSGRFSDTPHMSDGPDVELARIEFEYEQRDSFFSWFGGQSSYQTSTGSTSLTSAAAGVARRSITRRHRSSARSWDSRLTAGSRDRHARSRTNEAWTTARFSMRTPRTCPSIRARSTWSCSRTSSSTSTTRRRRWLSARACFAGVAGSWPGSPRSR